MAEKALQESRSFGVRRVPTLRPLGWLARGWADLMHCPLPGLLHGLAMALFGGVLFYLARERFWLLAGAFSGFLLVAPILATGLYAVSRALERGEPANLRTALAAWKPKDHRLIVFGGLLMLAGSGWMMTSASLITSQGHGLIRTPIDFIKLVVLAQDGHLFEIWLALGAVLAAPVFASTVMALPLLMDRQVSVLAAVFISWRTVMEQPAAMAFWAALLLLLTGLGMASLMLGLVVTLPLLSHASWHAYRDLVKSSQLEERI
jgi:uncharacterized membrane protein